LWIANGLEHALVLFRLRATAGWLFAAMLAGCVTLCVLYYFISIAPAKGALVRAMRALSSLPLSMRPISMPCGRSGSAG
jgi:hypothetical protein